MFQKIWKHSLNLNFKTGGFFFNKGIHKKKALLLSTVESTFSVGTQRILF